jgi:integrase
LPGWLQRVTDNINAGLPYNHIQQSLQDYLTYWLTCVKASLCPTTFYQYQMTCTRHLIPRLGHIRLVDLQPDTIQNLYLAKIQEKVGYRTIQMIYAILRRALELAVKFGYIQRNPAALTIPPKVISKEIIVFNVRQAKRFLCAADNDKNGMLYHLALVTGLRQSELLGLKWSDIDWSKRILSVQRQLKRNGKPDDYFSPLKTRHSKRVVLMGITTRDKLREHFRNQEIIKNLAGDHWIDNELIFPTIIGTPKNQSNLYREFKVFLKKIGLPDIRFHDLRHTSATLLLNSGISPLVVSRRLGHCNLNMTIEIYGHLMPGIQSKAAELIDNLVSNPLASYLMRY